MPPLPPADANSATTVSDNSIADNSIADSSAAESAAERAAEPLRGRSAQPQTRAGVNWLRFWIQMLVAMMVFNIIAGLVTWYFIFPHLRPPR